MKRFKSLVEQGPSGVIEFYAATFTDEPDFQGDVIDPRAFDPWLAVFKHQGAPLPIFYAHNWSDAHGLIGWAESDDVNVDDHGLKIRAQLNLDSDGARNVLAGIERGLIQEASFAFETLAEERDPETGANRITMFAEVIEAGPCLLGANGHTRGITVVKTLRCPGCGAYAASGNPRVACSNCGAVLAPVHDLLDELSSFAAAERLTTKARQAIASWEAVL